MCSQMQILLFEWKLHGAVAIFSFSILYFLHKKYPSVPQYWITLTNIELQSNVQQEMLIKIKFLTHPIFYDGGGEKELREIKMS